MAFRITPTTAEDRALMDEVKDMAWRRREEIQVVVRRALRAELKADARQSAKAS
jgi:hypothetical protein